MYRKYFKSADALNRIALKLESKDELGNFALSDIRWAENKFRAHNKDKFLKGEVYQFEFGKNYSPEMSYEHRGLVIGVSGKLLYVLPIFSYVSTNKAHMKAYHIADNPDEKQDLFLMKSSEFHFLKHDSVLKLNDIRSISVNRVVYPYSYRMDINGDTYKKIEDLVIQKYFNQFHFQYRQLMEYSENLQKELEAVKAEKSELEKRMQERVQHTNSRCR